MKYSGLLFLVVILLTTGCIYNWSEDDLTVMASMLSKDQSEPEDPLEPVQLVQNNNIENHQQMMMDFWNETIDNTPSDFTKQTGMNFYWSTFDRFPHPTFKMGTEIAYQRFARLLLTYMQTPEIFDYLADYQLFDIELTYGEMTIWGSFRTLVTEFSSEGMLGSTTETCEGLKQIASQIADLD